MAKLKPLKEWICDVCGDIVTVEDGYIIWRHTEDLMSEFDFKIIHQGKCDIQHYPSSGALKDFLGTDGLIKLTSFLSHGPIIYNNGMLAQPKIKDIGHFIDFLRRVQVPYYEEARIRFKNRELLNDLSDANEVYPYLEENLRAIIENEEYDEG